MSNYLTFPLFFFYKNRNIFCFCCLIISFLFLFSSCKTYSFTGASVSPDLKTIYIDNFINTSQNGNTAITQNLTDKLKNRFVAQTPLKISELDPDIEIKGQLTQYALSSQAPPGGAALASISRLTFTVSVEFINNKNEAENWQQNFSRFAEFPSDQNLLSVENELIESINIQLVDDIFNRAFANW